MARLFEAGNLLRHTATTAMNHSSSRSHAIFTLKCVQRTGAEEGQDDMQRVSRIHMADLAGSERQSKTGASGAQLKEGSRINQALSSLGMVIAALTRSVPRLCAPRSLWLIRTGRPGAKGGKGRFVPYRDSKLTWLLKDSFGGNAITTFLATVSPAIENYDETVSTLIYADRAKQIVNKPTVNEAPVTRAARTPSQPPCADPIPPALAGGQDDPRAAGAG